MAIKKKQKDYSSCTERIIISRRRQCRKSNGSLYQFEIVINLVTSKYYNSIITIVTRITWLGMKSRIDIHFIITNYHVTTCHIQFHIFAEQSDTK